MTRLIAAHPDFRPDAHQQAFIRALNAECRPWQDIIPTAELMVLPLFVWDYSHRPAAFRAWLDRCERAGTRLVNPAPLLRWNLEKGYLATLPGATPIQRLHSRADWEALTGNPVIKPLIGQSGRGVCRHSDGPPDFSAGQIYLAQPFIPAQFEACLLYLNGQFSHAVQRRLAPNEWRANSAYGATVSPLAPRPEWLALAERALAALPGRPCYARVDMLIDGDDRAHINELELIEPALYGQFDPDFPARFRTALRDYLAGENP